MNKSFNIKKADTTVPAFVISFHKVVAKDSYNSYFFLLFIQFPHAAVFGVFHLKASLF